MIQLDRHDATRLDRARAIVRDLGSVLIAYSRGVDSTLLLKLALDELGDQAAAVLASSPAYPESEQQEARVLAASPTNPGPQHRSSTRACGSCNTPQKARATRRRHSLSISRDRT